MDLQEVGCGVTKLIDLSQERGRWLAIVNAVMKIMVL